MRGHNIRIIYPLPLQAWQQHLVGWLKHPDIQEVVGDNVGEALTSGYLAGIVLDMNPVGFVYLKPEHGIRVEVSIFCPNHLRRAMPAIKRWCYSLDFTALWARFSLARILWKGDFDDVYDKIQRWCGYFGWKLDAVMKNSNGRSYAIVTADKEGGSWAEKEQVVG